MSVAHKCYVVGCSNSYKKTRYDKTLRYHPLPKVAKLRKIWIDFCQQGDKWKPQNAYICSRHFKEEDFLRDLKSELLGLPPKKYIKPDAVPFYRTVSAPERQEEVSDPVKEQEPVEENAKENAKEKEVEKAQELISEPVESENCDVLQSLDVAVQTDIYAETYDELLKRIENLEAIIDQYKDIVQEYQIKNEMLEDSIREAVLIKEHSKPRTESLEGCETSLKRVADTLPDGDGAVPPKKKLLWNSKEKFTNHRLKYLCKGCYIVSS